MNSTAPYPPLSWHREKSRTHYLHSAKLSEHVRVARLENSYFGHLSGVKLAKLSLSERAEAVKVTSSLCKWRREAGWTLQKQVFFITDTCWSPGGGSRSAVNGGAQLSWHPCPAPDQAASGPFLGFVCTVFCYFCFLPIGSCESALEGPKDRT